MIKTFIFTKVRLLLRSAYQKQVFSLRSLIAIVQRYHNYMESLTRLTQPVPCFLKYRRRLAGFVYIPKGKLC